MTEYFEEAWRGWAIVGLAAINLVSFVVMALDKYLARTGRSRVPERVLLLLALPMGFPGAWLAMFAFHHKTRKKSFLIKMIGVTFLAGGVAYWLLESR